MTTSHRPQLEARNGAKESYVPTSIQHARLLPGHTKMKYRKRKLDGIADASIDGKRRKPQQPSTITDNLRNEASHELEASLREESGSEGDDDDDDDEEEEDEGKSDYEDEDEEEEDQEALLEELHKIRQERMVQKLKEEREKQEEEGELNTPVELPTVRKSWRSQTVLGREKSNKNTELTSKDPKDDYTNDMTKSKFHHDFLRKYVR
ncbi:LANO_0H05248g1_1 [Lachancea nothofagi CBS 11611]|uniref:Pre-mRNA-splicing factor CWC15 n=1 Tax=Lachancea nothofagi CBS 11611 TaxID=1266666 RepID=A0A1G4KLG9_9SACH|nr:LANO_0H05248g1_1 [Lachancea nothofagi CBS 11611]